MSVIWEMSNSNLNVIYITAAILFILSLIILLVFTKTVYFPLQKITEGANEYAAGNLEYRIDLNTRDEMGYLAGTLNYMSGELNKLEEYQRNFIANVSHDFRSPLTSIKGYLEAIIDGTIPPEMYEKYLTRVISETERLTKLTQGMLTLNSLDSKGYLSRSSFDINRVIKDTAASFEGTCEKKNINFELTFSDSMQMVYADLGKIQQVLYNLIDNAIKFSHQDSTIYIQTRIKNEKIFVSVKAEEITDHHMHSEFCMMSAETAKLLNETHQSGHRIVCVGTTSCRTVESLVESDGTFREKSAWTEIFIYPGYWFKALDALITNFHLPESNARYARLRARRSREYPACL